jgi:hypothetical protein
MAGRLRAASDEAVAKEGVSVTPEEAEAVKLTTVEPNSLSGSGWGW